MERHILYAIPDDEIGPDDAQPMLRLTIGIVSTLDFARYWRLRDETAEWVEATFGPRQEDEDGQPLPRAQEVEDQVERAYRRCVMLVALKQVEKGDCAPGDEEPTTWQEAALPQEWEGIEAFCSQIPWQLFDLWFALAVECNPDTFFRSSDEKKRRPGSVYVKSSTKRLTI